jgi:hypothetical protein
VNPSSNSKRHPRRARARGGWRSWVACYALVALGWPLLGPLPSIVGAVALVAAHEVEDGHRAAEPHAHHHHGDASDIPGSPTHPADHDCTPCQILKHLSRCTILPSEPATIALQTASPVLPQLLVESQRATRVASLPPVRGPPSLIA